LATAGIDAKLSVTVLDSFGNLLPTSCHSAAIIFSQSQSLSIGSQSLTCVEASTAILAYRATRSGQYGIEVHALFSKSICAVAHFF
jgi:hypothetical protein